MATTSELLLDELVNAAEDLLQFGTHEGECTNAKQMAISQKIPPCKKHESALAARKLRFEQAISQFKLLRDVFSPGPIVSS